MSIPDPLLRPGAARALASIGCWLAALLWTPVSFAACPDEDLRPTAANTERVAAALVCLHNQERKAAGVAPLRENALLATAAGAHSADMVGRRYFEHDTPESLDPFERMERAGYIRRGVVWNAGENIAWGTGRLSTPRSIMDAWMGSYGHRLTLLAGDFADIGIGISFGAPSSDHAGLADAVTYTVDFGWLASPQIGRAQPHLSRCLKRAGSARTLRARRAAQERCRRDFGRG